ncbi:MAG: hypothetical protein PHP46_02430, partial [Candidatus Omnitrophica bacterium]|nr:hypothetical protein [Candidatus Omnitrophota bacterium]
RARNTKAYLDIQESENLNKILGERVANEFFSLNEKIKNAWERVEAAQTAWDKAKDNLAEMTRKYERGEYTEDRLRQAEQTESDTRDKYADAIFTYERLVISFVNRLNIMGVEMDLAVETVEAAKAAAKAEPAEAEIVKTRREIVKPPVISAATTAKDVAKPVEELFGVLRNTAPPAGNRNIDELLKIAPLEQWNAIFARLTNLHGLAPQEAKDHIRGMAKWLPYILDNADKLDEQYYLGRFFYRSMTNEQQTKINDPEKGAYKDLFIMLGMADYLQSLAEYRVAQGIEPDAAAAERFVKSHLKHSVDMLGNIQKGNISLGESNWMTFVQIDIDKTGIGQNDIEVRQRREAVRPIAERVSRKHLDIDNMKHWPILDLYYSYMALQDIDMAQLGVMAEIMREVEPILNEGFGDMKDKNDWPRVEILKYAEASRLKFLLEKRDEILKKRPEARTAEESSFLEFLPEEIAREEELVRERLSLDRLIMATISLIEGAEPGLQLKDIITADTTLGDRLEYLETVISKMKGKNKKVSSDDFKYPVFDAIYFVNNRGKAYPDTDAEGKRLTYYVESDTGIISVCKGRDDAPFAALKDARFNEWTWQFDKGWLYQAWEKTEAIKGYASPKWPDGEVVKIAQGTKITGKSYSRPRKEDKETFTVGNSRILKGRAVEGPATLFREGQRTLMAITPELVKIEKIDVVKTWVSIFNDAGKVSKAYGFLAAKPGVVDEPSKEILHDKYTITYDGNVRRAKSVGVIIDPITNEKTDKVEEFVKYDAEGRVISIKTNITINNRHQHESILNYKAFDGDSRPIEAEETITYFDDKGALDRSMRTEKRSKIIYDEDGVADWKAREVRNFNYANNDYYLANDALQPDEKQETRIDETNLLRYGALKRVRGKITERIKYHYKNGIRTGSTSTVTYFEPRITEDGEIKVEIPAYTSETKYSSHDDKGRPTYAEETITYYIDGAKLSYKKGERGEMLPVIEGRLDTEKHTVKKANISYDSKGNAVWETISVTNENVEGDYYITKEAKNSEGKTVRVPTEKRETQFSKEITVLRRGLLKKLRGQTVIEFTTYSYKEEGTDQKESATTKLSFFEEQPDGRRELKVASESSSKYGKLGNNDLLAKTIYYRDEKDNLRGDKPSLEESVYDEKERKWKLIDGKYPINDDYYRTTLIKDDKGNIVDVVPLENSTHSVLYRVTQKGLEKSYLEIKQYSYTYKNGIRTGLRIKTFIQEEGREQKLFSVEKIVYDGWNIVKGEMPTRAKKLTIFKKEPVNDDITEAEADRIEHFNIEYVRNKMAPDQFEEAWVPSYYIEKYTKKVTDPVSGKEVEKKATREGKVVDKQNIQYSKYIKQAWNWEVTDTVEGEKPVTSTEKYLYTWDWKLIFELPEKNDKGETVYILLERDPEGKQKLSKKVTFTLTEGLDIDWSSYKELEVYKEDQDTGFVYSIPMTDEFFKEGIFYKGFIGSSDVFGYEYKDVLVQLEKCQTIDGKPFVRKGISPENIPIPSRASYKTLENYFAQYDPREGCIMVYVKRAGDDSRFWLGRRSKIGEVRVIEEWQGSFELKEDEKTGEIKPVKAEGAKKNFTYAYDTAGGKVYLIPSDAIGENGEAKDCEIKIAHVDKDSRRLVIDAIVLGDIKVDMKTNEVVSETSKEAIAQVVEKDGSLLTTYADTEYNRSRNRAGHTIVAPLADPDHAQYESDKNGKVVKRFGYSKSAMYIFEVETGRTFTYDTKGRLVKIEEPDGRISKECSYVKNGALIILREPVKETFTKEIKVTTVYAPLKDDGTLNSQRDFVLYDGAVDFKAMGESVPVGTLNLADPYKQGSEILIKRAWEISGCLGVVFSEKEANRIEDRMLAIIEEATYRNLAGLIDKDIRLSVSKIIEIDKIWSEMYNLIKARREAGNIEPQTLKRWAGFVKARLSAFRRLSYKEFVEERRRPEEYYNNIRYVESGLLTMIEQDDLDDLYELFTDRKKVFEPKNVTTQNGKLTANAIELPLENGKGFDMDGKDFVLLVRSKIADEVPVRITCVDEGGNRLTLTAKVTGSARFDSLSEADKNKLWHRVRFAPASSDYRYQLTSVEPKPPFDSSKVVKFEIASDTSMDNLEFKRIRVEGEKDIMAEKAATRQLVKINMEDSLDKSLSPLKIAKEKRAGMEETPIVEGVLYYDLTNGAFEPKDLRNIVYSINWRLPENYRYKGIKVIISFVDVNGGIQDEQCETDEEGYVVHKDAQGNAVRGVEVSCRSTSDFNAAKVIMLETRFELKEKAPFAERSIIIRALAIIGIGLLSLLTLFLVSMRLFFGKYFKAALSKLVKSPTPEVPEKKKEVTPPKKEVTGPLSDEALLGSIGDAADLINDWVDKIGVDFRMKGLQEEEKGVFLPSMRTNELWEFYDQAAIPRYNLNVVKRSLVFVIITSALYWGISWLGAFSFSGYAGMIHLYPYFALIMIFGLLNWKKLSASVGIGTVFLTIQSIVGYYLPSQYLDYTSFALTSITLGLYVANLLKSYYKVISNPKKIITAQMSQLSTLRERLLKTKNNKPLMDIIEDLTRYKRSRALPGGEKYEGGAVAPSEPFKDTLQGAIDEIDTMLARKPADIAVTKITLKKYGLWTTGITALALAGIGTLAVLGTLSTAVTIITGIITVGLASLAFTLLAGREARSLMLMYPAKDMKKIYRDYQRLIYNTDTGENLKAIDVRRFLVEIRAALNRKIESAKPTMTLQESLDNMREGMVNVRDTATVRNFMDTFHLTKLEKLPNKIAMLLRVGLWLFIFGAGSYLAVILSIVGMKELASLVTGGGVLGYNELFKQPFAIVEIGKLIAKGHGVLYGLAGFTGMLISGIGSLYFLGKTIKAKLTHKVIYGAISTVWISAFVLSIMGVSHGYYWEVGKWIPLLIAQGFFGMAMLGSLALFAFKFAFYFLGKYAKLYPDQKSVTTYHYIRNITGIVLPAVLLSVISIYGVGAGGLVLLVKILLFGELLRSAFTLLVIHKAKSRFKAIAEDDKLFIGKPHEGAKLTDEQTKENERILREREISFNKFVETVFGKYTKDDLILIKKANDLKRKYGVDWKSEAIKSSELADSEKTQYEILFGKGGEPSGTEYTDLSRADLEKAYSKLSKEEILRRMSGSGFNELKKYLNEKGKKVNDNITWWKIQEDPKSIDVTPTELRDFLNTSLLEKRIIMMYDLLPKFTPWIVVVGGEDAVMNLIQSLLRFRYPLSKLKLIFAGENWDVKVQDELRKKQKEGKFPPQLVFIGMAIREDNRKATEMPDWIKKKNVIVRILWWLFIREPEEPAQAYTKPGANTAVLNESDGISGIIYDAENIPNPNQPLQFILGTMDGIAKTRLLKDKYFIPAMGKSDNWTKVEETDGLEIVLEKSVNNIERITAEYLRNLTKEDYAIIYQFNFKSGSVLKRHLRYFTNHALSKLFEITEKDKKLFSTGKLWEYINTIDDGTKEGKKEKRDLINLYITLCNMPDYGKNATAYLKREISKDEFIKRLVIGEFRRINEPKNGQGRLAKINNALHRSKGQVAAYMFGEYASWYTAGWDGFHAAQDTFKPLGGTTGYFCTEPVEEIDWNDKVIKNKLALDETDIKVISEHHRIKNKLLTIGAWDEFQVAEDYMLGFVSWYYGFNVAAFYSLTPEDPAGFESELSFKFRPKQMSRWVKGYIIGLLVATEGNMGELKERKGLWGYIVFFVPTLCSAVHPLMFRIARFLTIFWWIYFIPLAKIGAFILVSPLGPYAVWLNNLTGVGTLVLNFQEGIGTIVPQILNFLPAGWAWGIGPAIVIIPIFIHRFFTMRGIFKGVDDYLGRKRIISEYDEIAENLNNEIKGIDGFEKVFDKAKSAVPSDIKGVLDLYDTAIKQIKDVTKKDGTEFLKKKIIQGGLGFEDIQKDLDARKNVFVSTVPSPDKSIEKKRLNDEYTYVLGEFEKAVARLKTVDYKKTLTESLNEIEGRKDAVEHPLINGKLKEVQGLISPKPYALLMALFNAAWISVIFANTLLPLPAMITAAIVLISAFILVMRSDALPGWKTPILVSVALSGIGIFTLPPAFASWIVLSAGMTAVFYMVIMFLGTKYIKSAVTEEEKSVRSIRFRAAMPNFFIDFYHMLYLSGNQIAWQETVNGGRIGYWWRTPRTVKIGDEVKKRHIHQLPGSKEYRENKIKDLLKTFFTPITKISSGKGEAPTIEERLEESRLSIQILKNYGFMVVMTLLVALGIRYDVQDFILSERMTEVMNRTGIPPLLTGEHIFWISVAVMAVFATLAFTRIIIPAWKNWKKPVSDAPWKEHAFTAKAAYKAATLSLIGSGLMHTVAILAGVGTSNPTLANVGMYIGITLGAFLTLATLRYFFLGRATFNILREYYKDSMEDDLPSEEDLPLIDIARSDGYRHPAFYKLSPRAQRLINLHEGFKSDFGGMVSIIPLLDAFFKNRIEKSVYRTTMFAKANSDNANDLFEATQCKLEDIRRLAVANIYRGAAKSLKYKNTPVPINIATKLCRLIRSPEDIPIVDEIISRYTIVTKKLVKTGSHYEGTYDWVTRNTTIGVDDYSDVDIYDFSRLEALVNDPTELRKLIHEEKARQKLLRLRNFFEENLREGIRSKEPELHIDTKYSMASDQFSVVGDFTKEDIDRCITVISSKKDAKLAVSILLSTINIISELKTWLGPGSPSQDKPIEQYTVYTMDLSKLKVLANNPAELRRLIDVELAKQAKPEAPKTMQFPKGTLPLILVAVGAAALLPVIYYLFGANAAKTYWTTASVSFAAVLMTVVSKPSKTLETVSVKGKNPSNLNIDKEFLERMDREDFELLKKIIASDEPVLKSLIARSKGKIRIPAREKEDEGRTVYLSLKKPIKIGKRTIDILRLKGIRPRTDDNGNVLPYKGAGYVNMKVDVDEKGDMLSEPQGEPYYIAGTMTSEDADREFEVMEKAYNSPVETDLGIGKGEYAALKSRDGKVGYVIAGMTGEDIRISLKIDEKEGLGYVSLMAENKITGETTELGEQKEKDLYEKIGRAFRNYHDMECCHGFPHMDNIGLRRTGDGFEVIIRDLDLTALRLPEDSLERRTGLRFLDVSRIIYDLLKTRSKGMKYDDEYWTIKGDLSRLLIPFLSGYFHDLKATDKRFNAIYEQCMLKVYGTAWEEDSAFCHIIARFRNVVEAADMMKIPKISRIGLKDTNFDKITSAIYDLERNVERKSIRGATLTGTLLLVAGLATLIWAAPYAPAIISRIGTQAAAAILTAIPAALGALMAGMAILPEKAEAP